MQRRGAQCAPSYSRVAILILLGCTGFEIRVIAAMVQKIDRDHAQHVQIIASAHFRWIGLYLLAETRRKKPTWEDVYESQKNERSAGVVSGLHMRVGLGAGTDGIQVC